MRAPPTRGAAGYGRRVTTYVALLRGVNVGGHAKVAMEDLRRLFQALGHTDVTTYIQSGNVVFRSASDDPTQVAADIEAAMVRDIGVAATVVLRRRDELARVAARNPFLADEADVTKLHVAFLAEEPDEPRAAGLTVPAGEPNELSLAGREVYLRYPYGTGRSKLSNTYLEKRLGVAATMRNWRTVTKLAELAAQVSA